MVGYNDINNLVLPDLRWLRLYIKYLRLNPREMGVLNITRIHPKGGKKQEIVAPAHQGYVGLTSWEMRFLIISRIPLKGTVA